MAKKRATKTYNVTIPIAGEMQCTVKVPVDATPGEIFEAATELQSSNPDECDVSWEFYEQLADGNVLNVSRREWSFTEE